jgi:hypothetical protein
LPLLLFWGAAVAEPTRAVAAARTEKSNFILNGLSFFFRVVYVVVYNGFVSEQKKTGCKKKSLPTSLPI